MLSNHATGIVPRLSGFEKRSIKRGKLVIFVCFENNFPLFGSFFGLNPIYYLTTMLPVIPPRYIRFE